MARLREYIPRVVIEPYHVEPGDPTDPLSCDIWLLWGGFCINWVMMDSGLNWIDDVWVGGPDKQIAEVDSFDRSLSDFPVLQAYVTWHRRLFWWKWRRKRSPGR